jgi:hypothetical protein
MSVKTFTRSFAGGEIAPVLYGRVDLAKFQSGLAKCLNFLVTPQGPIENRPGFEYLIHAKPGPSAPALIPFVFNTDQSFALEFGEGYIRFHAAGGTLLEASKTVLGVTQANPGIFNVAAHGFTPGQVLFSTMAGGMTDFANRWLQVSTVPDANHFAVADMFGNVIDTTAMPAFTSGTVARVYEIASPYAAADVFDLHYVQSADVLTIAHQLYETRELRRLSATNWTLTTISWGATLAAPAAPTVTAGGPGGGTPSDYTYVTTALVSGTLEESVASTGTSVTIDLTVAGNHNDITTGTVAGAVRYNIYKIVGTAGLAGYIGQSDGSVFRDENITPDYSKTPPIQNTPFAGDSPRAVSYYEQRRTFGGSAFNPQTFWATRSGTEKNLSYSIPTQDDDAITARIVSREANTIRHLVPLGDLLALTSGGVWRIAASDGGALTPASFSVKPQSYVGASNVQPVAAGMSALYVQDRGSHIRELTYKWESQGYVADDVSVLAPHLFDFHGITQVSYSRTPYQVMWAVRDDGVLLGMTHQPEHEVKAWHKHDTQGAFRSVCAIPEGEEDGLYAVVERTVQGQSWFYIERMHTRQFAALQDAFFVDSGATYSGAATSVIRGLWHVEGLPVMALADGGVQGPLTVTGGQITLSAAASTVHVGLAYNGDAQTLPLATEALAAFGQGVVKNVNEVALRVLSSSNIQSGPSFERLTTAPTRTIADNWGAPPGLKTGIVRFKISSQWQDDGSACIRQSAPLPMTVLALTLDVATGG